MATTMLPEHTRGPSVGMYVYDDEAFKAGECGCMRVWSWESVHGYLYAAQWYR